MAGDVTIPVNDELGFTISKAVHAGTIAMEWTVPAQLCNSAGNLQGGMLAAFADALLGAAASTELPEDRYPALAEMKVSIFRPAPSGTTLRGTGRVLKSGTRVLFVEAEVRGEDDVLVAKASGTEIPAAL